MEYKFNNTAHKSSGWVLKQINYLFVEFYDVKPIRGSSYMPTPTKYNNARCGLINIQNNDLECFKWCAKYHQTKKSKNDDRITILKTVDDKYNYNNVNYPASYDDIKQFEDNNKISVFVYTINEEGEIIRDYMGNVEYIHNETLNLLRISDDTTSHYVYIKHISRLLNLSELKKRY